MVTVTSLAPAQTMLWTVRPLACVELLLRARYFTNQFRRVSGSGSSSGSPKHIFSGCFALDTLVAARLGRRPHLRTDDATESSQFRADGQGEYEPWRDCFELDQGRTGAATGAPHRKHIFCIFLQFTSWLVSSD